jgi:hypothetical protein
LCDSRCLKKKNHYFTARFDIHPFAIGTYMRSYCLIFTAMLFFACASCFSQADLTDSSVYQQSLKNAINSYYKAIGENAHLYNGSEYVSFNYQNGKNPYFQSIFLMNGSVLYDDVLYTDVPLTYDIYYDEVIINRYNQNYRIKLINDKVGYFSFAGHSFVRIVQDSTTGPLPGTGYYDRLYNGNVVVLAKRKKKFEETINNGSAATQYVEDDRYFIKKSNVYYPVSNKQSILRVFKDKKKDIQKLLKKNKIKFKPNPEFGIVKAAQYYDQLKN